MFQTLRYICVIGLQLRLIFCIDEPKKFTCCGL